jgi:signal peptidase I
MYPGVTGSAARVWCFKEPCMSLKTEAKDRPGRATSPTDDGGMRETAKIIIQALALAMIVRVFLFQPFNIPSGSMKPTLLVGDYIFVSKLAYGYSRYSFPFGIVPLSGRVFASEPVRGDVIVFKLPRDNSTDYIKRLIGMPGDEIQMKDGVLHINGQPVQKTFVDDVVLPECGERATSCRDARYRRSIETLPNGVKYTTFAMRSGDYMNNTRVYKVPAGHYFMMGDNRDNSTDSRVPMEDSGVGYVPHENLVGKANIIFFSNTGDENATLSLFKPWTWPFGIRFSRFFSWVR